MARSAAVRPGTPLASKVAALAEAVELAKGRVDDDVLAQAERVASHVDRRLAFSGDITVVALAGATGSGKSTSFNALSGTKLAEPGVKRPTTATAMAASFGPIETTGILDWLEVPRRHAVTGGPSDLDGLVLLDLPDHDSTETAHRAEVDRLVQLVDMLIWVVDPQKYADAALHDRYLKPLAQHADVMLVVLNQSDKLTPEQLERCLRDLRALLDREGLARAQLTHMSAFTGANVAQLRGLLAQAIRDKVVAAKRLEADVAQAAAALSREIGSANVAPVPRAQVSQLTKAFSDAAGVPVVTDAVRASWRLRGGMATGWPALSWLARLKPDPLKALHLDKLPTTRHRQELQPSTVQRTSLPPLGGVHKSRVDSAVRALADEAGAGLPRGWADAVLAAARRDARHLPDDLDRAVATSDLALDRGNGWWTLVRVLQWILLIAVILGLGWLLAAVLVGYFQLPALPTYRWHNVPLPTLLVGGGVLAGLLLAGLSRIFVELGARSKAARAGRVLREAVSAVAQAHVVEPVNAELKRYEQARDAVRTAR